MSRVQTFSWPSASNSSDAVSSVADYPLGGPYDVFLKSGASLNAMCRTITVNSSSTANGLVTIRGFDASGLEVLDDVAVTAGIVTKTLGYYSKVTSIIMNIVSGGNVGFGYGEAGFLGLLSPDVNRYQGLARGQVVQGVGTGTYYYMADLRTLADPNPTQSNPYQSGNTTPKGIGRFLKPNVLPGLTRPLFTAGSATGYDVDDSQVDIQMPCSTVGVFISDDAEPAYELEFSFVQQGIR